MLYHVLKWFSSLIVFCYFTHHPTTCVSPAGTTRPLFTHKHVAHYHWYKYTVQTSAQWVFTMCVFLKSLFLLFFFTLFRKYIKHKDNFYMFILVKNTLATLFFLLFTNLCVVRHSAVETGASGRVFFQPGCSLNMKR